MSAFRLAAIGSSLAVFGFLSSRTATVCAGDILLFLRLCPHLAVVARLPWGFGKDYSAARYYLVYVVATVVVCGVLVVFCH